LKKLHSQSSMRIKKLSRMVEGWPPLSSKNYSVCQIILNNNVDENEET